MKNLLISIAILLLLVVLFSHYGPIETQPEQEPSGGIPTIQGYGTAIVDDCDLVIYEQAPTPPAKKSNTVIAYEVINGKWGNGAERKERLTAAGYNYKVVQAIVNDLLA